MRRVALLLPALAATACSAAVPVSGARVLDRGALEGVAALELGGSGSCQDDVCGLSLGPVPSLGLRAGILDRRLDAGLRAGPSQAALDVKLELFRSELVAVALDPALHVVWLDGAWGAAPRAFGQVLAIGEWTIAEPFALVAFGGPMTRLAPVHWRDGFGWLVGGALDVQLTTSLRLHPWLSLRLPSLLSEDETLVPVGSLGIALGFGDAVRPPIFGGEAAVPGSNPKASW